VLRLAGESKKASALLENSPGDHTVDQDLLLARIYSEQGDDVSASHIYSQLMQVPKPTNPVLRDFAWFQASRGSFADAREILKRLDTSSAGPGEIQLINADFEATFGTSQSAAAAYRAAASEAPTNPQTWLSLAGFDLRGRDFYAAAAAADEGLKWNIADPALTAMAARARTLATLAPEMDVQPLIESLSLDPGNSSGVATLTALATSHAAKESPQQSLARLNAVAQANLRYLPVQLILASRDGDAGLNDDAVQVASRAVVEFPTSPESARLLARINYSIGRWSDALAAATEWRKRTLAHPQPADNAVACDQEQLGNPEAAFEILAPFMPRSLPAVQASPNVSSDDSMTVFLDARALALRHNYAQMQIMLAPLCSQSGYWRRQCLKIIAETAPDAGTATAQISKVEAAVPAGSIDDRVALADARFTAGVRLGDEGLLQRALDGLQALTDAGSAPVDAWILLGGVDQALNQPADAEKAYRQALSTSPGMPTAANNLATLILQRNGDLREARSLAQQAVAAHPGDSTFNTTLGQVEAQAGDLDAAQAQLENAVRLDPQNTSALVSLAEVLCRAAKLDKALATVQRVDNIMQITHKPLAPAVRLQLDKVREACKAVSAVG
jgi:Tfp pilus assembly protein PilF